MTNNIKVTFGSKNILEQISNNHPDRRLSIFKSMNTYGQYQIIDESNKPSIFHNTIKYIIIFQKGTNNISNFINYLYFNLDKNNEKIFNSKLKELSNNINLNINSVKLLQEVSGKKQLIIMTEWNNSSDFSKWFNKCNIKDLSNISLSYKKE
ncbi:hypothetical protein DY120_03900 [Apilactobacillus micheneri]|uniref:ABM domain-containing protein n=1 Tax=Apilactobacillus micheneri TaxID=1899430 RepID=A0ABY2YXR1_9LACO|nr:hypothetical protein [Apilactobacillus micheneri]TPR25758.1 hypothetical protein DY114_03900 [Apilactobacillus micheneri]TPR26862.1 hypothetical protein DY111_03900 [Apilactobacillus micheneri]TPR28650.1 hypothetical protein DY113_01845 [Apilactobacillus micheneri]TPR29337.1 hypothetical protein DY127_06870 [Apilactobacillus micheneri]TPR30925.1 hypothetical protein DY117_03900 [Apilactobacillus micheneri]